MAGNDAVDQALDLTRNLNPQGLYSYAAEVARNLPQASGTPQQYASMLQKQGVKPAELENSGVNWQDNQLKMRRDNLPQHFEQALPPVQETEFLGSGLSDPDSVARRRAEGRNVRGPAQYEQYSIPGGKNYRELLLHAPKRRDGENYESSHWRVPNVLAHLRMSEREDRTAPRKPGHGNHPRMLHLEELQSDWGQDARKHGLRDVREITRLKRLRAEKAHMITQGTARDSDVHEADSLDRAIREAEDAVPHHPHIANTNAWVDLGLKRALLEAAKGDHSRLAWTPGQEQADRYGLHKKFSRIHFMRGHEDDDGTLKAFGPDGRLSLSHSVREYELPQYIGDELSKRLLAQEPYPIAGGQAYGRALEGAGLETGGEGMKAFYDRLVPQRLAEIVKKLGHKAEFEPIRTETWSPVDDSNENERTDYTLHSLKMTPELRASILKGMPAFKNGGDVLTRASGGPVRLAAAAIRHAGRTYTGRNHNEAVANATEATGDYIHRSDVQHGFVDNRGSFLHRDDPKAAILALGANQIRNPLMRELIAGERKNDSPYSSLVAEHLQFKNGGDVLVRASGGSATPHSEHARQMGFEPAETWYHGTTKDFPSFVPKRAPRNEQMALSGVHLAQDPAFASLYAEGNGGNIVPVHVRGKYLDATQLVPHGSEHHKILDALLKGTGAKPYWDRDGSGNLVAPPIQGYIDQVRPQKAERVLRDFGYDGVRYSAKHGAYDPVRRGMTNVSESHALLVFDPKNIRARTAKFANDESHDLMAARGGAIDHALRITARPAKDHVTKRNQ